MRQQRLDKQEFRADRTQLDTWGRLIAPAKLTRTGIFEYRSLDGGVIRELRTPEEVFRPEHLESIKLAPLTLGHPGEWVDSKTWKYHARGVVASDVRQDGDFIAATVMIADQDAVVSVLGGKTVELSMGYEVDIDPTPGEWEGQAYDAVQKNLLANHAALVVQGRAGPEARVALDGDETLPDRQKRTESIDQPQEEDPMPTPAPDAAVAALTAQVADLQSRLDKAEGELAAARAAVPDLAKLRADVAVEIKARADLEARVARVMPAAWKPEGKDDGALRREVVTHLDSSLSLEGRSDAYVEGVFESLLAGWAAKGKPAASAAQTPAAKADGDVLKAAYRAAHGLSNQD